MQTLLVTSYYGKKEEHSILKEMLTPGFLKQFKSYKGLNNFIDQLFVKGMEQILEGELDGHLGYAQTFPARDQFG